MCRLCWLLMEALPFLVSRYGRVHWGRKRTGEAGHSSCHVVGVGGDAHVWLGGSAAPCIQGELVALVHVHCGLEQDWRQFWHPLPEQDGPEAKERFPGTDGVSWARWKPLPLPWRFQAPGRRRARPGLRMALCSVHATQGESSLLLCQASKRPENPLHGPVQGIVRLLHWGKVSGDAVPAATPPPPEPPVSS